MAATNFAGRLKELRVQAGFTQEALAAKAGMSKAGIADLEQSRREPGWGTVIALAAALGVTCRDFLSEPAAQEKATRGRPQKAEAKPDAGELPYREPVASSEATMPIEENTPTKKRRK